MAVRRIITASRGENDAQDTADCSIVMKCRLRDMSDGRTLLEDDPLNDHVVRRATRDTYRSLVTSACRRTPKLCIIIPRRTWRSDHS